MLFGDVPATRPHNHSNTIREAFCGETTDTRRWKYTALRRVRRGGVIPPNYNIYSKTHWKVNRAAVVFLGQRKKLLMGSY